MRRKIFRSMCAVAAITILLTSVLVSRVMYTRLYESMERAVKDEASYIAAALNSLDQSYLTTIEDTDQDNRITLIAADGTVLFDSFKDPQSLDNHLLRPEVQQALASGAGDGVRFSNTLGEQTYYYAILLDNGMIIRVANTTESVFSTLIDSIPLMLLAALCMVALAMLLARWQTSRIVAPINAIDVEKPLFNDAYEELYPLLRRIEKQNHRIQDQLVALKKQQEEFASITENMNEGLMVLNAAGVLLHVNKSALNIFSAHEDTIIGRNYLILNRSIALKTVVDSALMGKPAEERLRLNGQHYQLLSTPIKDEKENLNGAVILVLDETEHVEAEQLRREFTANVSHELKTPLTSIYGYAEIIKNGIVKPEDISRFSDRILSEAARLIALIEDIMALSRLDEGTFDFPREEVDLYALTQAVIQRLAHQAEVKGVTFQLSGTPVSINGVRQLLEELIYNLCDNAIKYNRENGTVSISIEQRPEEIVLAVADTGIGIPKRHQARIFERFYRVDKSHSRQTGGTGLGLSIVKHAAKFHNARIVLTSQVDVGSTFTVYFPIAGPDNNEAIIITEPK